MASFRDLSVWQRSMDLLEEIYQLLPKLPNEERHALSEQMRRAAVSIPSNIAEGQARDSKKAFLSFLAIAQGSRAEIDTQLEICVRLHYLSEQQVSRAKALCDETGKMLRSMIKGLRD